MTPTLRRKLEALAERREEIERLLADPATVNDAARYRGLMRECSQLEPIAAGLAESNPAWRRVVGTAAAAGVPIPGFSSALSYYDLVRAPRTNAALTQGLRDFFGSHTYQRVDKEGTFHTLWSGDRTEVQE